MNKNTTLTILKFSIVIMLLSIFLFYFVDIAEPQFIAVCITMFFCSLVYVLAINKLRKDEINPIDNRKALIAIIVYLIIILFVILIRIL